MDFLAVKRQQLIFTILFRDFQFELHSSLSRHCNGYTLSVISSAHDFKILGILFTTTANSIKRIKFKRYYISYSCLKGNIRSFNLKESTKKFAKAVAQCFSNLYFFDSLIINALYSGIFDKPV